MVASSRLRNAFVRGTLSTLVVALLYLAAASAASAGNSLYGFTSDGLFYIHKDVVAAAGADDPKLVAGINKWERVAMKRTGDYYIYQAKTTGQYKFPLLYCFDLGGERYIPHVLVDMGSPLINPDEVKPHGNGGYNFFTKPQSAPRR